MSFCASLQTTHLIKHSKLASILGALRFGSAMLNETSWAILGLISSPNYHHSLTSIVNVIWVSSGRRMCEKLQHAKPCGLYPGLLHRATSSDTSAMFLSSSGKENVRGTQDSSSKLWIQHQWKPFTQACKTFKSSSIMVSLLRWIFSATRWVSAAKSEASGLFLTPMCLYNFWNW